MKRYYYHGIEQRVGLAGIETIEEIINSGAIRPRPIQIDENTTINRLCLYRKNEDYDYNNKGNILTSARDGWIDNCMFFVILPDIEASKTPLGTENDYSLLYTNLIDERRTSNPIPLNRIVGIAFPFETIIEDLEKYGPEWFVDEDLIERPNRLLILKRIIDFAKKQGWMILNSNEENLCDRLDEQLDKESKATSQMSKIGQDFLSGVSKFSELQTHTNIEEMIKKIESYYSVRTNETEYSKKGDEHK